MATTEGGNHGKNSSVHDRQALLADAGTPFDDHQIQKRKCAFSTDPI